MLRNGPCAADQVTVEALVILWGAVMGRHNSGASVQGQGEQAVQKERPQGFERVGRGLSRLWGAIRAGHGSFPHTKPKSDESISSAGTGPADHYRMLWDK